MDECKPLARGLRQDQYNAMLRSGTMRVSNPDYY
jgi:hypothetical protein